MTARHPSRLLTLVLAAAGGVVADLGFPGTSLWGLTFVGVALLFLALGRDSARWNAVVGLVWGLAFFVPHLLWTTVVVGYVGLALAVLEALFVALFGAAWSWARRGEVIWRSPTLQVLGFAVLWVGLEEARAASPFGGFPWGRLAFSQADSPVVRIAWLGGVPLTSAAVAGAGAALAVALLALRHVRVLRTLVCLAVVGVVVGVGLVIPIETRAQSGTLRIGAVQGNVDLDEDDLVERQDRVIRDHAAGTLELLDDVAPGDLDIVLWPENVTVTNLETYPRHAAIVEDVAQAVQAPILVGSLDFPESGGRYNLSQLWQPGVGVVGEYRKQRPAPFAEYIPLRDLLRPISGQVDRVSVDMLSGTEPGFMEFDAAGPGRRVGLAVVICFEVAYDWVVREAVAAGGEFLVIQTNNVTFGMSDQSLQQLAMSRLRAVETGRATVQISTVGVSASIAPNGAVSNLTDLFTAEQFTATLPLRTSITPAVRLGQWIVWGFAALAAGIVAAGAFGARRTPHESRGGMLA